MLKALGAQNQDRCSLFLFYLKLALLATGYHGTHWQKALCVTIFNLVSL